MDSTWAAERKASPRGLMAPPAQPSKSEFTTQFVVQDLEAVRIGELMRDDPHPRWVPFDIAFVTDCSAKLCLVITDMSLQQFCVPGNP